MGMSYLLDTHVLLWWLFDDPKLNTDCRDIIREPEHRILVSSVSAWEIATKYRIRHLQSCKALIRKLCSPQGKRCKKGMVNAISSVELY